MAKKITYANNDDSALHWIANLPDDEYHQLWDRCLAQCPKDPVTLGLIKKKAIHTMLLIPVIEKDGRIPQDEEFQQAMRALDISPRKLNDILEGIYGGLRSRSSASA